MQMNSPHEKAVKAILYGHSCAMRLKLRFDNPMANDGLISNYDLSQSIVDFFSNAISILSEKRKSEDEQFSDLSSKDSTPPPLLPQKSHSKKRKMNITNSSETWRDDSPDPIYYDGFLWRKYGQKSIQKSYHQRSYYKCSYNIDLHCEARKHQQQIKDNPPVYRTTYFGSHTCEMSNKLDNNSPNDMKSAGMIRFGTKLNQDNENNSSTSFPLLVKQEDVVIKKETMDQSCEETDDDQDCQQVKEEDQSSRSSSGIESVEFDTDLFVHDLDSWDQLFRFGLKFPY